MPSMLHEALLLLFRNRPSLAPELVQDVLGVSLPSFTEARVTDANLSEVAPTEYRADLVVLLLNGVPVFAIVVEVQLGRDERKRFSWPYYGAGLRAKLRCPVCVLVVAPDPSVADWARYPIDTGQPGSPFIPLVLGPEAVPQVRDVKQAEQAPELAVLSALAHGNGPEGGQIGLTALAAARRLDDERAKLYHDLVWMALNEAARRALEDLMANGHYEYQSDFAKKYVAEGEARGRTEGRAEGEIRAKAEVLLKILVGRGLAVSENQRARVLGCTVLAVLDRWIDRAFQAATAEEVLD